MAEPIEPFDEAEAYLLGRLTPAGRQRFETRLAEEAALCHHVRELEEGLLVVAMSAPQFRPPPEAWSNIHSAVDCERGKIPVVSVAWLKWLLGTGVVACCLLLIHLAQIDQTTTRKNSGSDGRQENFTATSAWPEGNPGAANENPSAPDDVFHAVNSTTARQKGSITSTGKPDTANLPSSLQTAVFPPAGVSASPNRGRQSSGMQKAMVLAMAQQVGLSNAPTAAMLSENNVKFVQLTAPARDGSDPTTVMLDSPIDAGAGTPLETMPVEPGAAGAIEFFASDNNLVVAVDPSLLPPDAGPLTLWQVDADGNQSIIGTVALTGQPTVITVNNANLADYPEFFVTVGGTNLLGHFPP
jgi:hypothetical protein